MKKLLLLAVMFPMVANADVLGLDDALRSTYVYCVGIDDELADLKKMAGINTAVTAVGTGLGAGATVVGVVKANKDAKARVIAETTNYAKEKAKEVLDPDTRTKWLAEWDKADFEKDFKELRDQSKKLGNWRTGLMAGNTATNIAGAIIAGNNKVDEDLQTQIGNCKAAVKNLRESIMQARMNGEDVTEANNIVEACSEFNYVDVSSINDKAKGAMISSIVGAATGVAGTVTSAVANSETIRKDKAGMDMKEKTAADWDKEENWNTAANVLAGTSTVASGVATVFNATQISAIKKVANVASKCTEVLK